MQEHGDDIIDVNGYCLDIHRGVLERDGRPVPIRPKSFALLCYFARHADRVVAKNELIEAVWGGLAITDDALTQTIKNIRHVIDDRAATVLRTVPRRGYMLVAAAPCRDAGQPFERPPRHAFDILVEESTSPVPLADERGEHGAPVAADRARRARLSGRDRPAIAVLPFAFNAEASRTVRLMRDGLLRDIIRDLARLRTIFVIAANSLQALSTAGLDSLEAGRLLRCDYVCAGTIAAADGELRLDVELIATDGGHVLLSERFARPLASISRVGAALAGEIAMLLADEVDLAERKIAIQRPSHALDAWQSYHRGLWHMHRFTGADNAVAENFFKQAIDRDPGFARPYTGLSFTHWMKAYVFGPSHLSDEGRLAYDLAARAVAVDPYDPAAHCAFGRALWLIGAREDAVEALERATLLSPSYAFGHYARAFTESFSGNARTGIEASDRARELSPFDPFLTANQGSRALALLRLGKIEEAVAWSLRSISHPNAHVVMRRVAILSLTAAGRLEEAKPLIRQVNRESPENGSELFIRTNRMLPEDEKLIRELSRQSGLL